MNGNSEKNSNSDYVNFLSNLTFVIQGQVNENVSKVIDGIKINFPNSKIVVSTWENSVTPKIEKVRFIFNKDPGSFVYDSKYKKKLNYERQRISSLSGISACETEYVAKIRSDMIFYDNYAIKRYYQFINKNNSKNSIFSDKIGVINFTTIRSFSSKLSSPYHFCDWMFIGKKDDVINFFIKPWIKENKNINYVKPNIDLYPNDEISWKLRYRNETCYILSALKSKGQKTMISHSFETNDKTDKTSFKLLQDEFVLIDYVRSKIRCIKYPYAKFSMENVVTEKQWEKGKDLIIDFDKLRYCLFSIIRKSYRSLKRFQK